MLMVLLSALMLPIDAKTAWSFPYGDFNTATVTYKNTDKTYKSSWQVAFTFELVWNTTPTGDCKIRLNNTNDDLLEICVSSAQQISLWSIPKTGSAWEIFNTTDGAQKGKPFYLFYADGYLSLQQSNGSLVMQDFVLGTWSLEHYGAYGAENNTISGYFSVEVSDYHMGMTKGFTDTIVQVMVLVITLSLISGVLIKMQRKAKV